MIRSGTKAAQSDGAGQLNVEEAVRDRYSAASQRTTPDLCCPVEYDSRYLDVLPDEIVERDYGCGDPSKYVQEGETVLDLGSGGGKICFIASQVVGSSGRVIGVDCNDDMLHLARKYQHEIAERIGHHNVTFHKGRIQDLALDLDLLGQHLAEHPIVSSADWLTAQGHARHLQQTRPMVADNSVDVVLSNCVLNLVRAEDRYQLFAEIHRVLKPGGRAVISDITSDEPVPEKLRQDPELWSGCISGAFQEPALLEAFEQAGFYGIRLIERKGEPWATIDGIEFRSVTIEAFKGKEGPCKDRHQAVIYKGPWKSVTDDDGHVLRRGQRTAVCDKTYRIYTREPYCEQIEPLPPYHLIPLDEAADFDCHRGAVRDPRETKGQQYDLTALPDGGCCGPGGCC